MDYRREIDGLRALAVLPVILFHAGFQSFGGGFVGVDVFFVISGYLITTIILLELRQGRFSLAGFYERRGRRILPALFVVMLACLPLAWFTLSPGDMKDFAQSLAALSVFASNFLFWHETGYFSTATELKPLLHTWSLAVEEQFYLIFPLSLMLAWRLGRRWPLPLIAIAGIASFGVAQWASVAKPEAAFYLLPTRAWELALGALVAFHLAAEVRTKPSRGLSEFGAGLGLALILYSVFAYDRATPFPGSYALAPTIGTALLILFATDGTFVGRFMGNKLLVGIGLISYSAYLWHQPLFAFARHRGLTAFDKLEFLELSLLSLLLAYLTWNFVESPFRNKARVSRRAIFTFGCIGSVFFACVGLAGHVKSGDLGQFSDEQKRFLDYFENEPPSLRFVTRTGVLEKYRNDCNFYDLQALQSGNPTVVPRSSIPASCFASGKDSEKLVFIWGDSHAQQLYYGLRKVLSDDYDVLQVASSGCPAQADAVADKRNYCEYSNWFALDAIRRLKPKTVIVGQDAGHSSSGMARISSVLREAGVKRIVFAGPSPHWAPNLPIVVATRLWPSVPRRTFSGIDRGVLALDKSLQDGFGNHPDVHYVSLIDYFCNDDGCIVYFGNDFTTGISSWDYGHLTPIASHLLARDVLRPLIVD